MASIDLRTLPCGGWKSSKIAVEKSGQWTRFIDADTGQFINPTVRIDFSKKYVPPKRQSARQSRPTLDKEATLDNMFVTAVSGIGRKSNLTIAFPVVLDCPPTSARRPKSRATTQSLSADQQQRPFDEVDLPKTVTVVRKYRGGMNRQVGGHRSAAGMPQNNDAPVDLWIVPHTNTPRMSHSEV
jgi:hypothetical protein